MISPAVSALHAARPGITEDLLAPAYDDGGRNPYAWLAELLPAAGPVLDLCCGSAALADHVGRYLGVDSSADELAAAAVRRPQAATVHADALTVDLRGATFAAVAVSMALMLLPLEVLLVRARDWLPENGVLAATVPMRDPALAGTTYNRLLAAVGWAGEPFPEPLGAVAERACSYGFTLQCDELRLFAVPIAGPADRELLLRSFYLARPATVHVARELLLAEVAAGRPSVGYPIRRIGLIRSSPAGGRVDRPRAPIVASR